MAMAMPAGYETDSDEESQFWFGDEEFIQGYFASADPSNPGQGVSSTGTGTSGSSLSSARHANMFGRGSSSCVTLEDFRMAVKQGNLEVITKALDMGVDVNTVFSSGWTALMYAASAAQGDIFKLLLNRGANPCYQRDLYTVAMVLCEANYQNIETVLECMKLLIEKGADINAYDRYHVTTLMYAARNGLLEVVQLLLDKGAAIDCQDTRGWTALSWATQREKLDVVKHLLERGADQHKKHSDGLSALDLARGKEEIVWLFERKSGSEVGAGDAGANAAPVAAAGATVETGESKKAADLKYGEMEVFLYGLDLGQYINLFSTHQVDFPLLLTMNEEDLTNMGITHVGVRKRLMEGIAAVHKRNWESSSLVPIRIKSEVKCPDSIAIVANLSKHLRYINSSIVYLKDQVNRDPRFLAVCEESSDPRQLLLHTGDALKNATTLQKELTQLYSLLSKELSSADYSPADFIPRQTQSKRRLRYGRLAFTMISVSALTLIVWKKDFVVENVESLVSKFHSYLT